MTWVRLFNGRIGRLAGWSFSWMAVRDSTGSRTWASTYAGPSAVAEQTDPLEVWKRDKV